MATQYVDGDLFGLDPPAIGHGCNCAGSMAGGVAREVAKRHPGLYRDYRRLCDQGEFRLGDAWAWQVDHGPLIYNLATQQLPGPDADLGAIRTALAAMLEDAQRRGLQEVGIPRIGSGIGHLPWSEVRRVFDEVGGASPVMLTVVTKRRRPRRGH